MSKGVVQARHERGYSSFPSSLKQAAFGATGALAGACTLPIEYAWHRATTSRPSAVQTFLKPAPVYRAAIRFWIFDVARSALQANPSTAELPIAVKGGLAGAAGGFSEVLVQSLIDTQRPRLQELSSQSGRLFLCFGSYTWLSTTFSDVLPPEPFWKCWFMGAVAGGLGNSIIAALEGARGPQLWRVALPKGALVIGTVISMQVTSCRMLLDVVEP